MRALSIILLVVYICCVPPSNAQTYGTPCTIDSDCTGGDITGTPRCYALECTKECITEIGCTDVPFIDFCTANTRCDTINTVCRLHSICDEKAPSGCALSFFCDGASPDACAPATDSCVENPLACQATTCELNIAMTDYVCNDAAVLCPNLFNPMFPCTIYPPCSEPLGCVVEMLVCNSPGNGICFTEECSPIVPGQCDQTVIPYEVPFGADVACLIDPGPCDLVDGYSNATYTICNVAENDPCGIYACNPMDHTCIKTGTITANVFVPTGDVCAPYINCLTGVVSVEPPVPMVVKNIANATLLSNNGNVAFVNETSTGGQAKTAIIVQNATTTTTILITNANIPLPNVTIRPDVAVVMQLTIQSIPVADVPTYVPYFQLPGVYETVGESDVFVTGCNLTGVTESVDGCVSSSGFNPVIATSLPSIALCRDLLEPRSALQTFVSQSGSTLQTQRKQSILWDACSQYLINGSPGISVTGDWSVAQTSSCPSSEGSVTYRIPIDPSLLVNSTTVKITVDFVPLNVTEWFYSVFDELINPDAYNCSLSRCTWVFNNQFCNATGLESRWPSSFCGLTEQELYELEVLEDVWFFAVNDYLALRNTYACTNAFHFNAILKARVEALLDRFVELLALTCNPVLVGTTTPVSFEVLRNVSRVAREIFNDTACEGEAAADRVCQLTANQLAYCNLTLPATATAVRNKTVECHLTPFNDTGVSYYTFIADRIFAPPPPASAPPVPTGVIIFLSVFGAGVVLAVGATVVSTLVIRPSGPARL